MFESYIKILEKIGSTMRLQDAFSHNLAQIICFISLLVASIALYFLIYWIIKKSLFVFFQKTKTKFDDFLIKNKVFRRLCLLIPAYLIRNFAVDSLPDLVSFCNVVVLFTRVYEIFIFTRVIDALLSTVHDIYNMHEMSKSKPIKGVIQVVKTIVYIVGALLIIAILTHRQLSNIFIGLGTASAVLMLVFKDPILGFVGSLQLSINDMVRIGDWIVMPQHNADGNVMEISLTSVKVQNWDNTITTIPTYSLISESFTNWRGVFDSDGRRICRSITIEFPSIKFCTSEMIEKFKHIKLIEKYVTEKQAEIDAHNAKLGTSDTANFRRQTNLGVFRAYITEYLKANANINQEMSLMVRQLQPTEFGIPLQIYAFSKNKNWIPFEGIQSDIFDHVLAIAPTFDIKIYQRQSNSMHSVSIDKIDKEMD